VSLRAEHPVTGRTGGPVSHFLERYGIWLLVLLLLVAFGLRLFGLDRVVDANHDEVNPLLAGFRLTQARFLPGGPWIENFLAQLFIYYNGASAPLIQFVNLNVLNLLGVPVREFFLFLPYAVVGTLSLLGLYFLGRRWFDAETGLLATLFGALAAYHIVVSRINHPMVGIFFIQVLLFLAAERLFSTRKWIWAALVSILLSLEVLSNNGFAFTLVVLVYFGWMRMRQEAAGEGARVTLKRVLAFKRETALIWWSILPLIVLVLQLGFFAEALRRGELVGLLAWSFGHRRPMSFTPATLGVFGSAFGFGLILVALAAFLRNLPALIRFNVRGLLVWWFILLGLPFLGVFSAQPVHLIATCGIAVFLLSADFLVRGMRAHGRWARWGAVAVTALVLAEGTSGALAVNYLFPTPNQAWYVKAEGQGALGWTRRYRGTKSAGYWIRKYGGPDSRVYINDDPNLAEFYLGTVRCECGDPKRKRLFAHENFRPDPPVDYIVLLEKALVLDELQEVVDRYHLTGSIFDDGERLARIYSREPRERRDLEHAEAVHLFDREFAHLDRIITSPYAGMTFWLN
jgi:hypothetical protein